MVPPLIQERLAELRRRERLVRFAWGICRWVAVVLLAILAGCVVDWLWDRVEDTPDLVRGWFVGLTVGVAVVAAFFWIVLPQAQWLRDDDLALRVEERTPALKHRLITAVQLNRPGASREGMSEELITIVTEEAQTQVRPLSFTGVADHSRIRRGLKFLVPVVVVAILPFVFWPRISSALLARHFLADVEVPRNVHLEPLVRTQVRPAGEKVTLAFRVTAENLDPETVGEVIVTPKGQPRDRYPLSFSHQENDGKASIYSAEVSASTIDFEYSARLGDGRLRHPGSVRLVPRPAVAEQTAWTVLPEFVGKRPGGGRYEVLQPRGDVVGIPGSGARVEVKTQRPIVKGHLELLGPRDYAPDKDADEQGPEVPRRQVPLKVDGESASGIFDLRPEESAYRIVVEDEHGFANVPPPRRTVRIVSEEAPTVVLLKDYFTPAAVGAKESLEDFYIEGMPVPIGETIRVPYLAEGPFGLGQSWFLYRVIKKMESGVDQPEEEPWRRLPLAEVMATPKTGPFDLRRGVFENTPPDKAVDFYALPSADPEHVLGRTLGGGRFHFKTSGIPDGKGGTLKLEEGDKIEYCVEIHADAGKHPERPVSRSESRVQTLGTYESLGRWVRDFAQEERRLREIDSKQRTLFGSP